MKNKICDQIQLKHKIETNQNLDTKKIKGIKNKPKIKKIKADIKNKILRLLISLFAVLFV